MFTVQKNFLIFRSASCRRLLADREDRLDQVVRLPDTSSSAFSHVQNFLFTGHIFSDSKDMPDFATLIEVWRAGYYLDIDGLCDAAIEGMIECRKAICEIPATHLFVRVWKYTPERSSVRRLLLSWGDEFINGSEARAEFARSLPQEILSDLAVAMASGLKHVSSWNMACLHSASLTLGFSGQ
jgi:hypothetical protein